MWCESKIDKTRTAFKLNECSSMAKYAILRLKCFMCKNDLKQKT